MSLLTRIRKQYAVYWSPAEGPDDFGRPIRLEPVEIRCRWEDMLNEFMDDTGRSQISKAKVYPDRELLLGGVLWQGRLVDVVSLDHPFENEGAREIKRFDKTPDRKAREFLYEAYLM